jgi:hypothetical protein
MSAVRRVLDDDTSGDSEYIDSELKYKEIFLGGQFGVALNAYDCHSESYPNRQQVGFYILHEDDGHWFTSEGYASAYWIPDLQEVLQETLTWVKANCEEFRPENCGGAIMGWLWRKE